MANQLAMPESVVLEQASEPETVYRPKPMNAWELDERELRHLERWPVVVVMGCDARGELRFGNGVFVESGGGLGILTCSHVVRHDGVLLSDLRVGVLKISFKGNPAVAAYAEFPAKVAVDEEGRDLAWIDAPIPHRVHAVRRVAKEAYGEYSDAYGDTLSVFPCGQPCVTIGLSPCYLAGQSGSPRIQGDTLVGLVVGVLGESTGVHIGAAALMSFLKSIGKCPDAIDGEDK